MKHPGENQNLIDRRAAFTQFLDAEIHNSRQRILEKDTYPAQEVILTQYRCCVGALSTFFTFVENPSWEEDGIGSCGIEESYSETGIGGPYMNDILELRREKRPKIRAIQGVCTFHKERIGCVLGELKSPLCVTFPDGDLPDIYNMENFYEILLKILLGGGRSEKGYTDIHPQRNWQLVILFLEEVKKVTLALQ